MVWHTDARGLYGPGAGTDECCYYGGTVRTDANGRFELDHPPGSVPAGERAARAHPLRDDALVGPARH